MKEEIRKLKTVQTGHNTPLALTARSLRPRGEDEAELGILLTINDEIGSLLQQKNSLQLKCAVLEGAASSDAIQLAQVFEAASQSIE